MSPAVASSTIHAWWNTAGESSNVVSHGSVPDGYCRRSLSGGAGVRVCSQGFTEAYCA